MSTRRYVVITHRNCRDGFVASICAKYFYHHFTTETTASEIIYWEVDPSHQLQNLTQQFDQSLELNPQTTDWTFRSFDVAFVPEVIRTFMNYCASKSLNCYFEVYDHHKSAIDAWSNQESCQTIKVTLPDVPATFVGDIDECGASLAWKYYFPRRALPKFILYVKDRDNWLFNTPEAIKRNSWDVNEFLMATSPPTKDLDKWYEYLDLSGAEEANFYDNATKMGKLITDMKSKQVCSLAGSGGVRMLGSHRVFVCNCTLLQSDVGNYAVNLKFNDSEPKQALFMDPQIIPNKGDYLCDWALLWRFNEENGAYCVSLRSRKGDVDVANIAKMFGGGGHAAAAGFECDNIQDILTLKLN